MTRVGSKRAGRPAVARSQKTKESKPARKKKVEAAVPLGETLPQSGTAGYGGAPTGKVQETRQPSKAVYGAAMARDLAVAESNDTAARQARPKIDALLRQVSNATGAQRRDAIRALNDFLGTLGPDIVDRIDGGAGAENKGIGYVNYRLMELGSDVTLEPIMDAQSRYFVKLCQPGDLRGTTGRISFDFKPYSEGTLRFLRTQGVDDVGMWSVRFEGTEAFNFRKNDDDSVSAKIRDLSRSVNGSLNEIMPTFIKMMGEQALPAGYTFEIDLDKVPAEHQQRVRNALAGLKDYGAELKYLVTDANKLIELAREAGALETRISRLLETPREQWTPEQQREYEEVFRLYHEQPSKRFEQE